MSFYILIKYVTLNIVFINYIYFVTSHLHEWHKYYFKENEQAVNNSTQLITVLNIKMNGQFINTSTYIPAEKWKEQTLSVSVFLTRKLDTSSVAQYSYSAVHLNVANFLQNLHKSHCIVYLLIWVFTLNMVRLHEGCISHMHISCVGTQNAIDIMFTSIWTLFQAHNDIRYNYIINSDN